jgi:hypothetical protein
MLRSRIVVVLLSVVAAAALSACTGNPAAPDAAPAAEAVAGAGETGGVLTASTRGGSGGRGDGPIVYVTSQGLFYDSIVTADPLPFRGKFQHLVPTADGLQTEWGPGDKDYRGGRWWVDVNENGEMDELDDHFFSCPLLGPGRQSP